MSTLEAEPFGLVKFALRAHGDACKEQLKFLRSRAGRREHRHEVLQSLRAVRRDLKAVESGDHKLAQRIQDDLLRRPDLPESALVLNDGSPRRDPEKVRAMYRALASEHEEWLASHPQRHRRRWLDQLATDATVEGAIWEALCRRWLLQFADTVEPAEDSQGAGPDFRCTTSGRPFYVEATCLSIDAATRCTGLSDVDAAGGSYAFATPRVWEAVESKQRQCQARSDAPTVVFVGTLHQLAAWSAMGEHVAAELLTGRTLIAWQLHVKDNVQVGSSGPFTRTDLDGAAYVAADGLPAQPLGPRNRHVAAVLVGTLDMFYPRKVTQPAPFIGAVHPSPAIPLEPLRALPGVRFLRLREGWQHGSLEVEEVLVSRRPVAVGTVLA